MKLITFLLPLFLSVSSQNIEIDSLKLAVGAQTGIDKIQSLNELSWHYKNINIDSAIIFGRYALELAQSIESDKGISASYNSLASAYEGKGQYDTALILHKQSYQIKIRLNDTIGMANSLNNIGIVYDELGKYKLSLDQYFEALRLYELYPDQPYNVAMVLGNIGIVYKKQKEYKKVIEYYKKALSIYEEQDSKFGITVTKGNIGSVFLQVKQFQDAIKFSEEAMKGYQQLGYLRYIPYMKNNMGIAYDSLGFTAKASKLYQEAAQEHKYYENEYELAHTLVLLAANYNKSRNYLKGNEIAEKAFQLSNEINALEFKTKALNHWSISLASLNRYEEAYEKAIAYNVLEDSLFEETKTRQIFELQTQYETEKKEQQIVLQSAQISEQEATIARNRISLIASIASFIFLIIIGLLWRNRIRKKQQIRLQEAKLLAREAEINATISSQEKERARYARDLHDGFGQMISILNMNIGSLKAGAKPEERQKVFEESEKVIEEMYGELKNICFDLMPQTLIKKGLQSALQEFADRINTAGKVFIETSFFGIEERLSEIQEISLYRIAQEWVNNILKYSDADKITLQITKDEGEITLLIEDDGTGFDKQVLIQGNGNGWKNLNTRTNLIKGELELETQLGKKGNVLIVNAPTILKPIASLVEV